MIVGLFVGGGDLEFNDSFGGWWGGVGAPFFGGGFWLGR